jgi:glycosyltransferase involved in cell wall biosynthesis/GT2 family glycosyltransferase
MKILWLSNPPYTTSAYGMQSAYFIPKINALEGFEIAAVGANSSLFQGEINWNGIPVLPMFQDQGLNDIIPFHMKRLNADAIITLYDPQVFDPKVYSQYNVAMWTPVDSMPPIEAVIRGLTGARWVWSWSGDGHRQLEAAGFEPDFVPLGIPTDVFKPVDRQASVEWLSEQVGVNLKGCYIVSSVAMNRSNPSRKNFWDMMVAFKAFSQKVPNAFLYMHTDHSNANGEPLLHFAKRMNIGDRVGFPPQYKMEMGLYTNEDVNRIYNASDVYLCTSYSEGFCVPLVEAQAAGCPVVATDALSMSELVYAGIKVPAMEMQGMNYRPGSFVFRINPDAAAQAMLQLHNFDKPDLLREKAVESVQQYDVNNIFEYHMKPALFKMRDEINTPITVKRAKVTVITPWLNHSDYIEAYEHAVQKADEVIIIDNGSDEKHAANIFALTERLNGIYYRSEDNLGFSKANNLGLSLASGDIVIFLNNDIDTKDPDWLRRVRLQIQDGNLYGTSRAAQMVNGQAVDYLEGWCLAAKRDTWNMLGGWAEDYPQKAYWDDVDICWRAKECGLELVKVNWHLLHLGGGTSRDMPEEFQKMVAENGDYFAQKIRNNGHAEFQPVLASE